MLTLARMGGHLDHPARVSSPGDRSLYVRDVYEPGNVVGRLIRRPCQVTFYRPPQLRWPAVCHLG